MFTSTVISPERPKTKDSANQNENQEEPIVVTVSKKGRKESKPTEKTVTLDGCTIDRETGEVLSRIYPNDI